MKIKELKKYVDKAYENGEECDVEFWIELDDGQSFIADVESIGQFNLVPDMTITVKPKNEGNKIYTTKIVDVEQFNYRDAYQTLVKNLEELPLVENLL